MIDKEVNELLKNARKEFDDLPKGPGGRRHTAPRSLWEQVLILTPHFSRNDLASKLGVNLSVLQRGLTKLEALNISTAKKLKKYPFVKVIPALSTAEAIPPIFSTTTQSSSSEFARKVILTLTTKSGSTITIFE